jgi:hydrogenase-4 component E
MPDVGVRRAPAGAVMSAVVDPLVLAILVINFLLLGTSRVSAAIEGSALQGAILGILTVFVHGSLDVRAILMALAAMSIKGIVIPTMLRRAMRDAAIRREIEPLVSYMTSLVLGALATAGAILFASYLPLAPEHIGSLLVPGSLATLFIGFIILTTRRKAITQVVGYLVLENGIFIMGLTLHEAMPFLVELGVLLDLLVAIFVIGLVITAISRQLTSLDVTELDKLRD